MFSVIHLRFDCVARTPIVLGREKAGHRLRGALGQVLLRAYCPEQRRNPIPTPEHAALCPACWLLAHETTPGAVRRVYSLVPPLPLPEVILPEQRFAFTLTLYGEAGLRFLPYFVLAVMEMGRRGVGQVPRGTFDLHGIWSCNPLAGTPNERHRRLLAADRHTLLAAPLPVDFPTPATIAPPADGRLTLEFLTPTRLIHQKRVTRRPDFGVFFRRLLQRLDQLDRQLSGAPRRPLDELHRLHALADRVRLLDDQTTWRDFSGWSNRRQSSTPLGGFVGRATYQADDWGPLLPLLAFGQALQVGKDVVKGHGVFQMRGNGRPAYWEVVYR